MIEQIARKLDFPDEAIESLAECEKKIEEKSAQKLSLAEKSIFTPNDNAYLDILAEIAEENGVNRYVCDMVFLLRCTEPLHEKYKEAGYGDELFYETVSDLKNKLYECKAVYGVWGTFVTFWYKEFLLMNIFALGRMQYERRTYPFEDREGVVKNGDLILSCHIPSSGPMNIEDIKDSLRRAYKFYEKDHKDGKLVVACFSWLLYPPLFEDYSESTNIKKFYNLFNIIDYKDNEKNGDFWRVFGVQYSPEAMDTVPVDNSLRRAVYEHIKSGGNMGYGVGIIVVDENY